MANLNYIIKGTFDSSAVDKAKGSFGGLSSSAIAGAAKVAAGFAGVSAAVVGATAAAVAFVASANKAENDSIRLATVQKNNFEKLGVSMAQLEAQTKKMSQLTIFDNNSIQQAQAALLGMGAVTKDTLDRVMTASADLASFLGTDITGAAQQLGKALAEPTQALGALERAGIRFSDAETKMIKSLVEAGRSAEAQDVILKKLESTIGGTAEAMGQSATSGAIKLKNSLDDLKNALGTLVGGALKGFFEMMSKIINKLSTWITKQADLNKLRKEGFSIDSSIAISEQVKVLTKMYSDQLSSLRSEKEKLDDLFRQYNAMMREKLTIEAQGGKYFGNPAQTVFARYGGIEEAKKYLENLIEQIASVDGKIRTVYETASVQIKGTNKQTEVIAETGNNTINGINEVTEKLDEIKETNRNLIESVQRRGEAVIPEAIPMQGNYGLIPDMSITSIIFDAIGQGVDPLVKAFITLFSKIESVNEILNWAETVIKDVFMLIDQPLKDVLKPVLDALFVLAAILARLLLPFLQVLAPVIKIIADGLILLFNYAIRPLANGIIFVLNTIMALIGYIWNGIAAAINAALGWAGVRLNYMNIPQPTNNFIGVITPPAQDNNNGTNGSNWSGAAASYSGGKEVNVYINFTQSYVNGDARAIALMLRDEIQAAEALGY